MTALRATVFDSMTFAPYKYQEYPKSITPPKEYALKHGMKPEDQLEVRDETEELELLRSFEDPEEKEKRQQELDAAREAAKAALREEVKKELLAEMQAEKPKDTLALLKKPQAS